MLLAAASLRVREHGELLAHLQTLRAAGVHAESAARAELGVDCRHPFFVSSHSPVTSTRRVAVAAIRSSPGVQGKFLHGSPI